jgi:hypothetical protein
VTARLDVLELDFQRRLHLTVGRRRDLRVWRQNVGTIVRRDARGRHCGVFHAGPPKGASDFSGVVMPEGWRLEVEMKSAKGKRSPQQIRWAAFMDRAGAVYALIAYDPELDLTQNLAHAVEVLEQAIAARRQRSG